MAAAPWPARLDLPVGNAVVHYAAVGYTPLAKYVPQPQATRPPLKELLEQRVRVAQETDLFRSPTPELFIPQQEDDGEFDQLDVVIVPPEVQRPRMCVFYVSGKGCREGSACPYGHPEAVREVRQGAVMTGPVCRYFLDDSCRAGNDCPQRHLVQCMPAHPAAHKIAPRPSHHSPRKRGHRVPLSQQQKQ